MIDGAFPLSCGESLAEPCELRYDAVDLIHGGETFVSIAVTIAMFSLFAAGLRAAAEPSLRGSPVGRRSPGCSGSPAT